MEQTTGSLHIVRNIKEHFVYLFFNEAGGLTSASVWLDCQVYVIEWLMLNLLTQKCMLGHCWWWMEILLLKSQIYYATFVCFILMLMVYVVICCYLWDCDSHTGSSRHVVVISYTFPLSFIDLMLQGAIHKVCALLVDIFEMRPPLVTLHNACLYTHIKLRSFWGTYPYMLYAYIYVYIHYMFIDVLISVGLSWNIP